MAAPKPYVLRLRSEAGSFYWSESTRCWTAETSLATRYCGYDAQTELLTMLDRARCKESTAVSEYSGVRIVRMKPPRRAATAERKQRRAERDAAEAARKDQRERAFEEGREQGRKDEHTRLWAVALEAGGFLDSHRGVILKKLLHLAEGLPLPEGG